ncbi:aminopeptidase N [Segnochrobactrum spirostomi]|uniref:Aminopeptidase N n=1 Tax=Segnochrobactrum spirostomi TaxID=2608987 RepID=A0A6A7Y194_9HYPH|nr:aminopeptidase N [Segnochrobactrum spirostomi]MQT12167.1 aminopeptidase N [Segnochrobactrum spirostomi]
MQRHEGQAVRLADYRPTPYGIETVHLDFRLTPNATLVTARSVFVPREGTPPGERLVLAGDGLTLRAVALDGETLPADRYLTTPDEFILKSPPAGRFTLEIATEVDPDANSTLMGLYRSSGNYCTQCEAEGFRRITYFYDRPDVLAVYTTRIEGPKASLPVLLANGNLIEAGDVAGTDNHFAVWHDPFPKPSYLFAMVAGDLGLVRDSFVTASGRTVDLRIYCEHGKEARCAYAMDSLKRSMRWDEVAFGREYDLDIFMIVAVSDFNMGAMENKGLNVFNDKYVLAAPETATDQDYMGIEGVIAHEYFHNWTGNRITCRDWFQLCLKEGLTVFRDQEFSSDERSRPVKRIADVRLLRAQQFPEDGGPLAHPVRPDTYREINNFYTATIYEKGAELIRALKALIGAEAFCRGMDLYFERHDGDAATIEDFVTCFAEASGRDLGPFLRWYSQAGTPRVTARTAYDATAHTFTLELEQTCPPTPGQPLKQPVPIPIRFGLVGPDGSDLPYERATGAAIVDGVIDFNEARQRIIFEGVAARPVPSLLRGFSAPVILDSDLTVEDRLFLLANDRDPFNRWEAAQTLAVGFLKDATAAAAAGQPVEVDGAFVQALGRLAIDDSLDRAFRALALQLPSEADIAREIGTDVDPDAIATARLAWRTTIATSLQDAFTALYRSLSTNEPFRPDAEGAGRRALRNVMLDYLALAEGGPIVAKDHYDGADNMTDRLAALTALVFTGADAANAALADFYRRFETDALVLDKWFAVQAAAPGADTLAKVKALTHHPAFSLSNPNRVRSLVGAFASGNQAQFNRADGKGYDFLADIVLALDPRNPQVAARLLNAFRSWRALEPSRRTRAEAALQRVAATTPLSRDVSDIAARCLE